MNGQTVTKTVNNLGRIKLADNPKLLVSLEPDASAAVKPLQTPKGSNGAEHQTSSNSSPSPEITIAPGQTVPAWLKVKRNGYEDLVTFTVENLPHGVIVDNIGLSGVLIPKDQNERQIFLKAATWVPETDRLCYAIENQAGRQTSIPVLLRVRKAAGQVASTAK